jgi:hypothetical protein
MGDRVWSWLMLCSATADLSDCASLICLLCSLVRSWMDDLFVQYKPCRNHMLRLLSSQTLSRIIPQHSQSLIHSSHTYLPIKMEQRECSETSTYKIQTPGNNPEESILPYFCTPYTERRNRFHAAYT